MSYLKESEIKKVEEVLLAKLSPPSKIKRISRKELFHEMQKIIPSLQDDQETPFCADVSSLINEAKIKGVYITRGRYGGIKLGQKPLKEEDEKEIESSSLEKDEEFRNIEAKPVDLQEKSNKTAEETLDKAKNSYLKSAPTIKCDWTKNNSVNLIVLNVKNQSLKLKLTLNHLTDLLKNVFLAIDATTENSNVKISIINSDFKTDKLLYVDEAYLDLLERLAFYHLGGTVEF